LITMASLALGPIVAILAAGGPEHERCVRAASYCLCWLPSFLLLFFAWWRVGVANQVQAGLFAAFCISGGSLGILFAMVLEVMEEPAWSIVSPDCNLFKMPLTLKCAASASAMWVLTPGLIEETGEAMWLFFRLRRRVEDVPAGCCCGAFGARPGGCCGCWYKLALTPYHVVLCALAAGAGFGVVENTKYVFSGLLPAWELAVARVATSGLHMVWTGLIGWGLARRLFCTGCQRPSLLRVILPSIIMHGLFDYSLLGLSSLERYRTQVPSEERRVHIGGLFVITLFLSSCGACCALAFLTGASSCCAGRCSCCCSPGFWEARFPDGVSVQPPARAPMTAAREVQRGARQPLLGC